MDKFTIKRLCQHDTPREQSLLGFHTGRVEPETAFVRAKS